MGKSESIPLILGVASVVLGGVVILTSGLSLKDIEDGRKQLDKYKLCESKGYKELCDDMTFYTVATALGIVAGIIQIGSFFLAYKKKLIPFAGVSCLVSLTCMVAMAIAVDYDILDNPRIVDDAATRADAAVAFLIIDMIFALGASIGTFVLSRK